GMPKLVSNRIGAVGLSNTAVLAEDIEHGEVGNAGPVRWAGRLPIGERVTGQARAELGHEARLADAWLAHDADDLSTTTKRFGQVAFERVERVLPPHEGCFAARSACTALAHAHHPKSATPSLHTDHGFEREASGERGRHVVADEDVARRRSAD